MNELALFAGIGGGILGGTLCGFKTVCAVEINAYCREVLLQRQKDGVLPLFPIWDDVKTFDGQQWCGIVDVVTAGFPCQPFSVAGKKKGEQDERNMWPDTIRILREVRPRIAFLENVPGLLVHPYFGTILGDLAESGYDCKWSCFGADDVGAKHRRKRLWILADSTSVRRIKAKISTKNNFSGKAVSYTTWDNLRCLFGEDIGGRLWCFPDSDINRTFDGLANWMERLKAIGNGQVPLAMAAVFQKLINGE